jgi:hypothetical protein
MILNLRNTNNRNNLQINTVFPVQTSVQTVERKQYETTAKRC